MYVFSWSKCSSVEMMMCKCERRRKSWINLMSNVMYLLLSPAVAVRLCCQKSMDPPDLTYIWSQVIEFSCPSKDHCLVTTSAVSRAYETMLVIPLWRLCTHPEIYGRLPHQADAESPGAHWPDFRPRHSTRGAQRWDLLPDHEADDQQ